ncbi:hypothetical protein ACFXNW_10820 [Nocardia sp. NPDC059180]|uniref:hypothetical protein n=1 Tax=Nocardia sp. NPDC059180 TaxID=3346761 RepID=UPI0036BA1B6A
MTRRLPRTVCPRCDRRDRCIQPILDELVCAICYLRARRDIQPCPGCGESKVLAFYDPQRRPACAACTGNRPVFACPRCGREDNPYGRFCGPCTLRERATELLSDHSKTIHPGLQPLFDAWMTGNRSQTTLVWLAKPSSSTDILRAMALGELPISHAAFDDLPCNRRVNYIRDLLAATGVIEPYQPLIARTTHWLNDILDQLPKHHGEVIRPFAQWQLLRRLRILEAQDQVTRGAVQRARADILTAVRLLGWLDEHDIAIDRVTQSDLDRYLARYPGRGPVLSRFLKWTNHTQLTDGLQIPTPDRASPQVLLSDDRRWQHVETLLHDSTIRSYTRIAGLFMLLFAQPLSRICRMRPDQVSLLSDTVTVTFDTVAVEMPEPLDQLLRQHLTANGPASHANRGIWLFPGRLPGKHLVTENIRSELVANGIHPNHARHAAMFHLAAEIPTPVLAELLGLSPYTANRWAALSARSWGQYTAMRRTARRE